MSPGLAETVFKIKQQVSIANDNIYRVLLQKHSDPIPLSFTSRWKAPATAGNHGQNLRRDRRRRIRLLPKIAHSNLLPNNIARPIHRQLRLGGGVFLIESDSQENER